MNPQRRKQIAKTIRQERKGQQNFVKPMTGAQASHIAKAEAGAEANPAIRAGEQERRGSVKRQGQEQAWYQQLAGQNQANINQSAALGQQTNANIDSRLKEAGSIGASQLATLTANDATMAQRLGGQTNAQGLAKVAQGNQQAALQGVALNAPLSAAVNSQTRYLGQRKTSGLERGIEAQKSEQGRRDKIKEDVTAARTAKGQLYTTKLEELRQKERENNTQLRAFPLERQKLSNEAANTATDNATAQRELELKEEKQRNENEKTEHPRKYESQGEGNKGEGGRTGPEKRSDRREVKAIKAKVPDVYGELKAAEAGRQKEHPNQAPVLTLANLIKLVAEETNSNYAVAKRLATAWWANHRLGSGQGGIHR